MLPCWLWGCIEGRQRVVITECLCPHVLKWVHTIFFLPEWILLLISCQQIFSWLEFVLSSRDAMFVKYPHRECKTASSEGAPQAKMYQLWMNHVIQALANCSEAHSIFSSLPISSQKRAAYGSKHPFVEPSFVISIVSTILLTKIKKPLWLRTFNG